VALSAGRAISRRPPARRRSAPRRCAPLAALYRKGDPVAETETETAPPQSGYLTASPAALRALAEGDEAIRRMGCDATGRPVIQHASTLAAEQAEPAAAGELERQALALESEALANVDRRAPLIERACELVRGLESRQRDNAASVAAGETSAPAPSAIDVADAEAIAAELRTAKAALDRLTREAMAAADRRARCRNGVARCSVAVLVDEAADMAGEIPRRRGRPRNPARRPRRLVDAAERRASPIERHAGAPPRLDQQGALSAAGPCREDPRALDRRLAESYHALQRGEFEAAGS
jgi:hypothetical protein